jgi:hypothetical protein
MTAGGTPPSKAQYALNLGLAGVAGQAGCVTLVIVFAAMLGGIWLDRWLGTKPVFTLLLLIGSVPITIVVMFRMVMAAITRIRPVVPGQGRLAKERSTGERRED